MDVVGVICEYNPLHLGHEKQLNWIRKEKGPDCAVVCLMSGNYVQRGEPAIVDKSIRAEAALRCGADLVLEMPVPVSLSSAEGFAAGSVRILSGFCDSLCFGAETADKNTLMDTATALLSAEFPEALHRQLDKGLSFPAARAQALETMGVSAECLKKPNDILAVEYCKAILAQCSPMEPMPIHRPGSYHASTPDPEDPSATALRAAMVAGGEYEMYMPSRIRELFSSAGVHTLEAGERAVLGKLRAMTDEEFEAVPFGSEGLWRKLMHAARERGTLEEIAAAVKSKRYTYTRISRMLLCAFLGITEADMAKPAPYVRVLGFTQRGREVLKQARQTGDFPNAGEPRQGDYAWKEQQWGDLYGLFAEMAPEMPSSERRRRVIVKE